jgi:hypothetical protein
MNRREEQMRGEEMIGEEKNEESKAITQKERKYTREQGQRGPKEDSRKRRRGR